MKKNLFLLMTAVCVLGAAACRKEQADTGTETVPYASIPVDLGRDREGVDPPDAKSLVSTDVENFQKAMLFAFDPSTGHVLTYGPGTGALEGQPVITTTDSATFEWTLPLSTAMDIYVIVNYGDLDMDVFSARGESLTRSDLEALTFTCPSSAKLQELESKGYGLPMSGITSVTDTQLTTGEEHLSLKVKKLFARYNLYFDISEIAANHSSVVCESAVIYNMNTTVHYFGDGDRSSTVNLAAGYDRATEDQLEILQLGGNSNQVVLYVLENLQGDIEGAASWKSVYKNLGSDRLKYCTYLNITVNLVNDQGRSETRPYRIYLGKTDMKSNFDVQRNYDKTIRMKISEEAGSDVDHFVFTDVLGIRDNSVLSLSPGESVTLYYDTTLSPDEIHFQCTDADTGAAFPEGWFQVAGITASHARFSASSEAQTGVLVRIRGGNAGKNVTDTKYLSVTEPSELNHRWITEPSYIGKDCRFEVTGLREGETVSGISVASDAPCLHSFTENTVTFTPGSSTQILVVATSAERSLIVDIRSAVPELTGKDVLELSIDGSWQDAGLKYVDPVSKETVTGFNTAFYATYLHPEMTVTPASSSFAGLVQAAWTEGNPFVYAYDISRYAPLTGYTFANVEAKPALEGIAPHTIAVRIRNPYSGSTATGGAIHDFSLIPPSGSISTVYLEEKGFSPVRYSGTWNGGDGLGFDKNAVSEVICKGGTLTITSGGASSYPLSYTVTGNGSSSSLAICLRVKNVKSSKTYDVTVATVKNTIHLAFGGVRTSLTSGTTSSFGFYPGGSVKKFKGGASFASRYTGSESTRFSDWPAGAVTLKNSYLSSGSRSASVSGKQGTGILATDAGYTAVYSVGSTLSGMNQILFEFYFQTRNGDSSATSPYSPTVSPEATSYLNLPEGGKTVGGYVIDYYGDLYPSSHGWIGAVHTDFQVSY